jgi:hypothetical protein
MQVVSNTSPLSALSVIGRLGLLRAQFGTVRIPTFDVGRSMFDVLSLFPIKNPKSTIGNCQSTPLPMGFTLTYPPIKLSASRANAC